VLVGHGFHRENPKDLDEKLKDRKYIRETGQELIDKSKKLGDTPRGQGASRDRRISGLDFIQVPNPISAQMC